MTRGSDTTFPLDAASEAIEPFIGDWVTTGAHGLIPDTVLHGRTSIERLEPGGFLRITSSIDEHVGIPTGVAIVGGDGATGRYVLLHHDERGVTRVYDATVQDRVLRWWRDGPEFDQRYTLTVSPDGASMVGEGELRHPGAEWDRDLDLTYTRA
jgi:hypothetical protein